MGLGRIVNAATGSLRFIATFSGAGGHSFAAFGLPSAIHAMGRAVAKIADLVPPEASQAYFRERLQLPAGQRIIALGRVFMPVMMMSWSNPQPCVSPVFDKKRSKFKDVIKALAAYFERFHGIWAHGDFASWTEHGGVVIHGRSDATLNPGGVRIGTAEIYRQVEQLPEVVESLVIGQDWPPGEVGEIVEAVRSPGCRVIAKGDTDGTCNTGSGKDLAAARKPTAPVVATKSSWMRGSYPSMRSVSRTVAVPRSVE